MDIEVRSVVRIAEITVQQSIKQRQLHDCRKETRNNNQTYHYQIKVPC